jgi:uncharacterized protein Smg (DUF494 family)
MRENIVDIIAYLMTELRSNHPINEHTVVRLNGKGYSQTEISTAFSWLADRAGVQEFIATAIEGTSDSIRILHEFEKMFIEIDVYGYILQLWQLGVLSHTQVEEVIEQSIATGQQPIELAAAKEIIGTILFNVEPYNRPERRIFLRPTDAIH